MYWASEVEWPLVRHSRDKKKQQWGVLKGLRVARRVQQLSKHVDVKINGFSSFLK
jgi:hypothetical protein